MFDQSAQSVQSILRGSLIAQEAQAGPLIQFPETPRADLEGSKDTSTAGVGGRVNDPKAPLDPA